MADRKNGTNTDHRNPDGTFGQGNPARPVGPRNAVTRAVEEILQREVDGMTRKAVQLALDSDTTALRRCLARIAQTMAPTACAQILGDRFALSALQFRVLLV
jgi:hypothetical protein